MHLESAVSALIAAAFILTSLNAGITSLAAIALGSAAVAQAKTSAPVRFEPARHDKDDWLEKPAKHRLVFDTIEPVGFGRGSRIRVQLHQCERRRLRCAAERAGSGNRGAESLTPFAYNDKMWAKYGKPMAARARFEDPKTKEAPIARSIQFRELRRRPVESRCNPRYAFETRRPFGRLFGSH